MLSCFLKKIGYVVLLFLRWGQDITILLQGKCVLSVLCYHRINDSNNDSMTVSTETFAHQVQLLKKHYHVISAAELYNWLEHNVCPKHKKAVLITFDDGYEDNYSNALPILKNFLCPAIFFVPTAYIGTSNPFTWDRTKYPDLTFPKMSWEQLQEASKNDIEIGIHSDTHIDFGKANFIDIKKDIEKSLIEFKHHFNKKNISMAYPFGGKENITHQVREYIKQHQDIVALFAAYGGKNINPIDRYNIKRIFISSNDKGIVFRYRVAGGPPAFFRKLGFLFKRTSHPQA